MAIVLLCIWVAVISGQVCLGLVRCKNIMEIFGVFISTLLGIAIEAVVLDQIYMDNWFKGIESYYKSFQKTVETLGIKVNNMKGEIKNLKRVI